MLLSVLTFEGLAFEKNIKFDYDITPNIEMVMNENQIRQLIEILLDNAIKHSDKKGIVTIKLKKEGNITSPKSFKTIIISSDSLIASDYELYTGGSNSGELSMGFYKESNYVKGNIIKINGISTFTIQNTINLYN